MFTPDPSLREVHRAMVCVHPKFRDILFSGAVVYRRVYRDPVAELDAMRHLWRELQSHAQWYFPDMLCVLAGWVREAAIICDHLRLANIKPETFLYSMGFTFTCLDFLETAYAEFMDRWLQIRLIEPLVAGGAYRWNPRMERWSAVCTSDLFQTKRDQPLLDLVALDAAVFEGRLLELGEMPGVDPALAGTPEMKREPSWSVRSRVLGASNVATHSSKS